MKIRYTEIKFQAKATNRDVRYTAAAGYTIERDGDTVILTKGDLVTHRPWQDVVFAHPETKRTPTKRASDHGDG